MRIVGSGAQSSGEREEPREGVPVSETKREGGDRGRGDRGREGAPKVDEIS